VEGVEKRAEIRVYLRLEVAREKSESFTSLDSGACKNDAL
jgi:hypothetical protein